MIINIAGAAVCKAISQISGKRSDNEVEQSAALSAKLNHYDHRRHNHHIGNIIIHHFNGYHILSQNIPCPHYVIKS